MNNILVTGANGQLGSEIKALAHLFNEFVFFFTDKDDLDITNIDVIRTFIKAKNINSIINCAAYTAVDLAEDEFEMADLLNHKATKNLAKITKEFNLKLIHISTDYVFNGKSNVPYNENDITDPESIYGKTKLNGELSLKKIAPKNSIIIRTAWLYSSYGNNFIKTMLRLGKEKDVLNVIYDQIGSPTYALDLALVILKILPKINNKKTETYHYTNEGVCSWYDFAIAIFEIKKIKCQVIPIPTAAYPTKAARPHYSILDKQKIKNSFDITIPHWRNSLKECLDKL
ncbi:dTDP-4-dehydrorhamnose reductase [Aquimarina agarilytica]|uniref:dTDP-4-dehydrorhamnose reductase n=1 Tax=Aquimarina agarilytica TaxID=1087449 RepID=UPI0002895CC4|nr:dTDP-4-dehydrorhamnose reductase [Aquimarina agarilytica]